MSTRFSAKRQVSEETFERVNWIFAADLNTLGLSISEKSGLVKVDLGLGRRNPSLYRNEILAILDKADEIRRYLDDHPDAKNTPPTAKELQRLELLQATIDATKNQQMNAMVQSMRAAGLTEDVITATIAKLK